MNSNSSKTSLFLMELIMSILFFCLASAVCVQMFVKSHTLSRDSLILNHAIVWSESMAETFYSCDGDLTAMNEILESSIYKENSSTIDLYFDEEFNPVSSEESAFYLVEGVCSRDSELELLTLDIICVDLNYDEEIYSLSPKYFPNKEVN